jgi:hypothetical protein
MSRRTVFQPCCYEEGSEEGVQVPVVSPPARGHQQPQPPGSSRGAGGLSLISRRRWGLRPVPGLLVASLCSSKASFSVIASCWRRTDEHAAAHLLLPGGLRDPAKATVNPPAVSGQATGTCKLQFFGEGAAIRSASGVIIGGHEMPPAPCPSQALGGGCSFRSAFNL